MRSAFDSLLDHAADSTATLKNSLSDPYIKAIRRASDRLGEQGIVCFVTNSGFVEGIAADGVRKNPKLSGTTHNVFGIQVGVSISLFVRKPKPADTFKP